jgi:hypothetical protein
MRKDADGAQTVAPRAHVADNPFLRQREERLMDFKVQIASWSARRCIRREPFTHPRSPLRPWSAHRTRANPAVPIMGVSVPATTATSVAAAPSPAFLLGTNAFNYEVAICNPITGGRLFCKMSAKPLKQNEISLALAINPYLSA